MNRGITTEKSEETQHSNIIVEAFVKFNPTKKEFLDLRRHFENNKCTNLLESLDLAFKYTDFDKTNKKEKVSAPDKRGGKNEEKVSIK